MDGLSAWSPGRTRHEVIAYLIEVAHTSPDLVVGLDFAFSFPHWFAEREGATSVEECWNLVAEHGEDWLAKCGPPFWGRPGKPRPDLPEDGSLSVHGATRHESQESKSQERLPDRRCGCGWHGLDPWNAPLGEPRRRRASPSGPFTRCALQWQSRSIHGCSLTPVNKSDFSERRAHLAAECSPEIGGGLACKAASSEDAFDAAVSAVVMSRHIDEIATLTRSQDPVELIEGATWWPQDTRAAATTSRPMAQSQTDCPFCDISRDAVIDELGHALAIRDRYPVSCGHTLVLPRAHVKSLFDLDAKAQADIWHLVARVRDHLHSRLNPDGFNIGINDGRAAGQTVEHAHVHVIPRFDGDVADPRGGIRWILPECAAYWNR